MKSNRFLHFLLIYCLFQMPSNVFGARQDVSFASGGATPLSTSATGGLANEMFSFDPRLAAIKLEYVDFKIDRLRTAEEWGKNIGQYNFKLFGCKRSEKNIVLDQGRAMRRDMKFSDVFFEEMNELFPVVVNKDSPYFPYSIGDRTPGYVVTAEIKDLFVNVCDAYDWRTRTYSHLRSGSAEIKVLWRVMTPYNRKVYWEDTTHGYATITDPIRNGEVRLVEKAFADALVRIVGMPGFMQTMRQVPDPRMIARAKSDFDAMAYAHIQNRKNLMSSYRRRRMKFYNERERERILETLEKIGPSQKMIEAEIEKGLGDVHRLEQLEKMQEEGIALSNQQVQELRALEKTVAEETDRLRALAEETARKEAEEKMLAAERDQGQAGKLLAGGLEAQDKDETELASDDSQGQAGKLLAGGLEAQDKDETELASDGSQGQAGKLLTGTMETQDKDESELAGADGDAIYARMLQDRGAQDGVFGRLLTANPLLRLYDGALLPSALERETMAAVIGGDLAREGSKYGFVVSPIDGWITINNQMPFRYLSPIRMYRIRSSVVAVTNEGEVGSGLVIAPSLVLTNYEIAKRSPYARVEFLDGRVVPTMVLRADQSKDVALLYMPPAEFDKYNWPIPLRLDLPDIGESFYAVGTPMRGGFEGALEDGKVAGYRYTDYGVDILTNTNVQSVSLGGILVDEHGNAIGLAHAGESFIDARDGFIPIGDAFDVLKVKIRDREVAETPTEKALRLKKTKDDYIK